MEKATHYEETYDGFDLFAVSVCGECGRTKVVNINHYYGKRRLQSYRDSGLKPLPKFEADEICECE